MNLTLPYLTKPNLDKLNLTKLNLNNSHLTHLSSPNLTLPNFAKFPGMVFFEMKSMVSVAMTQSKGCIYF